MSKINHPDYYSSNGIEAINVIDAFNLNFNLGNVIKYILRAGKKKNEPPITTLQKANWYLVHEINRLKFLESISHEDQSESENFSWLN